MTELVELAVELATELFELLTELVEMLTELATLLAGLLEDDCGGTELLEAVEREIEHSFTPPEVRGPNTASEQTKLPDNNL